MKIKPNAIIRVPSPPTVEQHATIEAFAHAVITGSVEETERSRGGSRHPDGERSWDRVRERGHHFDFRWYYRLAPSEQSETIIGPAPTLPELTQAERYLKGHKASGIQVGDTVKVIRKAGSKEDGWGCNWTTHMNAFVGQSFRVHSDEDRAGFRLRPDDAGEYAFPFFVLEKVTPEPTPAEKPPLGIMPEKIWLEKRILALTAAIDRYISTGKDPDQKWIDELQVHLDRHRNISSKPL